VDGIALLNLTDSDILAMFPSKVGLSSKLIVLLNNLRKPSSLQVRHISSIVNEVICCILFDLVVQLFETVFHLSVILKHSCLEYCQNLLVN
jgi:hypothetical protein